MSDVGMSSSSTGDPRADSPLKQLFTAPAQQLHDNPLTLSDTNGMRGMTVPGCISRGPVLVQETLDVTLGVMPSRENSPGIADFEVSSTGGQKDERSRILRNLSNIDSRLHLSNDQHLRHGKENGCQVILFDTSRDAGREVPPPVTPTAHSALTRYSVPPTVLPGCVFECSVECSHAECSSWTSGVALDRSSRRGPVGVPVRCMLCVCDSEQRERGVGANVNATMLSETL